FFRPLRNIRQDDIITLTTMGGEYRYRVVATWVVNPSGVEVLGPSQTEVLTLVTCYPFYFVGSAPQRFIVRAERTPAGATPAGDGSRVASGEALTSDGGDIETAVPLDPN